MSMVMELGLEKLEEESEMRCQYVDYILKHPEDLLSRLPKDEMDILLYIYANRDKAKGVPTVNVEKELMMEIAGVADTYWDDDACRFTTDEIQEAGYGDVPTVPNKRQEEFWHFLTRELQWDDYYARRICFELWYKANHADDPGYDDDETIEAYFDNEALSFDGITDEERRKGRQLLADYVAHIPHWTLKGHAPAER